MNFSKDDQNTFLLVGAILVVCVVTIIIILGLVWNILLPPIKDTTEKIGKLIQTQLPSSYNFTVPAAQVVEVKPEPRVEPSKNTEIISAVKYDLPLKEAQVLGANSTSITNEPLVQEVVKAKYLTGNDITQTKFNVKIDSIQMNAPSMLGSNMEFILQSGFLIYPGSDLITDGTITLVCYRSQFKSTDPRSCWNLDKLRNDDEIVLDNLGLETKYKIIGTNIFNFTGDFIYQKSDSGNYLHIVTNDGPNRLVILAEKLD